MAHESRPAALVRSDGALVAANAAFYDLFETSAEAKEGQALLDVLASAVPGTQKNAVAAALQEGGTVSGLHVARTSGSPWVLDIVSTRLAGGAEVMLVVVTSWRTTGPSAAEHVSDFVYDVSVSDPFRLKKVWSAPADVDRASRDGARCHRAFAESEAACRGCPCLEAVRSPSTVTGIVRRKKQIVFVGARRVESDTIRISTYAMTAETLRDLHQVKLDALADRAALTTREREVLALLALGRTAPDIGAALAISLGTAKFHQTNVLRKLGAESRFDVLRMLA